MPTPTLTLAEFWELLARSGLVDAGAADTLRKEQAANPAGCGGTDPKEVARWLAGRGVITRWQAKRLGIGNLGPFFFGDYRLLERHDGAGDELVFTARHDPSGRIVSLVLLDSKWCKRLDTWTEIVRQTTAANAATDPMLSRTWSLEQHEGKRFIICEHVVGTNLADELERRGPLPGLQAGVLVSQLARAVADLHAGGAVHGSLSLDVLRREPSPGGVERTGRVRLLQFPLVGDPHRAPVRPWRSEQEIPALGRRAAYVAPELTLATAVCDERSDVYSIGAILYALLSGTHPCWEGDAARTLKRAALGGGPRPLEPPGVSPELATLVGYLMARDPAERYQTATEAAEAIADCLGLAGTVPTVARSAAPAPAGPAWPPSGEPAAGTDEAGELPDFTFAAAGSTTARPATSQPAGSQRTAAQPSGAQPSGETAAARLMRRRAARLRMIGAAVTLALLATVVGLVVSRLDFGSPAAPPLRPPQVGRQDSPSATPARPAADERPSLSVPVPVPEAGRPAEAAPRQVVVEDATLPWKSPTEGPRPRLAYLPPGTELALVARPADLAADEEGRLFLKALGPVVEGALAKLASFCGCEVADIEMVQAGWQAGEADSVLAGYAVRLVKGRTLPGDEAARRQTWGPTMPRDVAEETVHVGKPFSFWVPAAEQGRVLVVASDAQIETDIPAAAGAPAVREPFITAIVKQSLAARDRPATALSADLPLQLASLVGMLDADRHVTLFGSPHYLLNRGRGVLAGPLAKLAGPLEKLFGDSAKAAAVSAHFGANTYLELDVVADRDLPAKALAPQLADRVEALAPAVEEYCALLNPSPYGRVLVMRLPSMLRTVVANMRAGAEGNAVVLNAYLPRHAGHNLALAAELALAQAPGAPAVAVVVPNQPAAAGPAGADALGKLEKKITLVFARDTLEMAIQMVSDEVGVPMEILGTDLQLDGITQNQSFALEQRDQPAAAVLGVILKQANPAGKLVYVVRQEAGGEKLYITTRAQAEKRKEPLPPQFQAGDDPQKKEKT